jgi:TP901 family phage tail tape measure protein
MAKYSNTLEYNIKTKLDKTGLTQLSSELSKVQNKLAEISSKSLFTNTQRDTQLYIQSIESVKKALSNSFNGKFQLFDYGKFNQEIKNETFFVEDLGRAFSAAGTEGQIAFNNMISQLSKVETGTKKTSSVMDKLFNTFGNTVRWGITASIFQTIQNSIYRAIEYTKELDQSLNDIRIVSEYTAEDMKDFAKYANEAAQAIGQTTTAYTNASLIFAQQGYDLDTSNLLAEVTLKTANVTGQDTSEVSEQLTALYNGFHINVEEAGAAEEAVDKLAKVAAIGAADLEELATAESKVASSAYTLGVSQDQLAAQISTIISVTRESAETVGNSLRTIYARFADLKLGEVDEDGVGLGEVSSQLEQLGVTVLDESGNLRNMGDIIEDLMDKWNGLTTAEKQAAAVSLAGKYQYNRLMTLMENQSMYNEQLEASINATGTLQEQNDIYMESYAAKAEQMQAAFEGLFSTFFSTDDIKPFMDTLTTILNTLTGIVDTAGGGKTVLLGLGSAMVKSMSGNIATTMAQRSYNKDLEKFNQNNSTERNKTLETFLNSSEAAGLRQKGKIDEYVDLVQKASKNLTGSQADKERENEINQLSSEYISSINTIIASEDELAQVTAKLKRTFLSLDGTTLKDYEDQIRVDGVELNPQTANQNVARYIQEFLAEAGDKKVTPQTDNMVYKNGITLATLGHMTQNLAEDKFDSKSIGTVDFDVEAFKQKYEEAASQIPEIKEVFDEFIAVFSDAANKTEEELTAAKNKLFDTAFAETNPSITETFTKAKSTIGDFAQSAEGYKDGFYKGKGGAARNAVADKLQAEVKNAADIDDGVKQALDDVVSYLKNDNMTRKELQKKYKQLEDAIDNAANTNSDIYETPGEIEGALQHSNNLNARKGEAEENVKKASAGLDAQAKFADTKQMYSEILSVASAVGQLSFAWQSFTSLGPLWSDEDASIGEKIIQTIGVLSMNIPSMISGFASLNEAIKNNTALKVKNTIVDKMQEALIAQQKISNEIQTKQKIESAAAQTADTTATVANTAVTGAGAVVEKVATKATEENNEELEEGAAAHGAHAVAAVADGAITTTFTALVKVATKNLLAMTAAMLTNPWTWAAVGVAALATGIGILINKEKERIETLQENADKATEVTNSLKEQKSAFDDLYESYKSGEASNSDMKSAADELNKTLDNQTLKTLAAAGAWDEYYKQLSKATSAKLDETYYDLDANTDELYDNAKRAIQISDFSDNAKTNADISKNKIADTFGIDASGITAIGAIKQSDGSYAIRRNSDTTVDEFIADADKLIEKFDNVDTSGFSDKEKKDYQNFVAAVKSARNNEAVINYESQEETKGENRYQAYKDDADFQYTEGTSTEDYRQQIKEALANKGILNASDKMIQAFVDAMAESNSDLAETVVNELQTSDIDEQAKNEAMAKLRGNEKIGIEGTAELNDSIGTQTLVNNVNEIIEDINNGSSIEDIKIKYSLDTDTETDFVNALSDDEISALQDKLDMTADEWNNYTYAIEQSESEAGNNLRTLSQTVDNLEEQKKNLVSLQKCVDKNSDAYKDYQKQIDKVNSELEAQESAYKSVAAKAIQSAKGAEQLADCFEDAYNALTDSTSSANQVADAIGDLEEPVGNLLNIDFSAWGDDAKNSFLSSTENLNLLKEALNGNDEALGQLRANAATAVLIDAKLATDANDIPSDLASIISAGQQIAADSTIEVGADLNDQPFVDTLNAMLASGKYTEKELTDMLTALGFDTQITYETKTIQVSGYDEAGIGWSSQQVQVPKFTIKKASTSASSIAKTYTGAGGGSSSDDSGGGSESSYEAKTQEYLEDEIDRYEKVNTKLDAIAADFSKIADEQDRLAGYDVIDNLNQQITLLKKQISLYQEKLELQKQEAEELKSTLSSDYGISFDGEGFITNYATIHQKLIDEVNSLVDQYNATTTEDGQEALADQIDAAKDKLDKFKDTYSRYDELISGDLKDTIATLEDLEDQIEDLRITAFQTQVEAAENIKDIQEALIEFNAALSGRKSDDPFRAMSVSVQKLSKYFDVATESANEYYDTLISRTQELANSATTDASKQWYENLISQYKEAQKQAGGGTVEFGGTGYLDMNLTNLKMINEQIAQFQSSGTSGIFGENSADLYDVAKDIYNNATTLVSDFEGEIDDLRNAILDAIDEIADEMDTRLTAYENITDELEHQSNIIQLLRGENSYDELNRVLQAQQANYQASIGEMQQYIALLEEMQKSLEEGSEEWQAVNDNIVDTQQQLNELIETSLENLQQQYTNTVNSIIDSLFEDAFGSSDLDWLSTEWELINRNADYYLDSVNKAYNIQKLQSQYMQLLNNTDGLATQQKITQQMNEQLEYLREKTNLSEYDVAYAQAQLEILQKQIALEEAQKNKSQMKLKRDSQGNYSYVYTADNDAILSAQQDLLDAQNNAYNLSKEQMTQTQADSLSAIQQAKQTLADIWTSANLTVEEKTARTQTVIDSLKEYLSGTAEQLSTSQENIVNDFYNMVDTLQTINSESLQEIADQMIADNEAAFDQIDTRWSTSLSTWLQNLDTFNSNMDNAFADLVDAANDYSSSVDEIADLVGQDFNDMTSAIANASDKTAELTGNTDEFFTKLNTNSGLLQGYAEELSKYQAAIVDLNNGMTDYKDQINSLSASLTAKEQENAQLGGQINDLQNQLAAATSSSSSSGSGSGDTNNPTVGATFGYTGKYYYDSWGTSPAGALYAGTKNAIVVDKWSSTKYGGQSSYTGDFDVHIKSADGKYGDLGWIKKSQLFDTGGYTGTWGSGEGGDSSSKNGKLAWLHQKELILNASDTENILAAVNAVREMTDNLRYGMLNNILGTLTSSIPTSVDNNSTGNIEQNITIQAEFPNANSVTDIQEALLSLDTLAVQYAYRK